MYCRDVDLKRLLQADGDDLNFNSRSVEEHLEKCSHCQSRLADLAGETQLSNLALKHLRDVSVEELEWRQTCSSVSIELSSLLSMDAIVDLETVDLDFLGDPAHPELLGRLDRYDVERVVGSGGMGIVLKAHDGELNRVVAIKVLAPHLAGSSAARRRFSREARAAAAVLHPNVLPIFNVESEAQPPYFVMQYVAGQSLQARVDRDGPLEIPTALRIARQTASALAAAHKQGVVHRDVKPANILLEEDVDRAQLSDFGLARTVDDASLTRTGIVAGTPHYMSPEQANGDAVDARSDLFSLGCTLYFMLAGRPPFRAETTMAVLNRICHHPHRPLHGVHNMVPRELSQLVDRLLAKRAAKRFDSADALESELDRMLAAIQEGRMKIQSAESRCNTWWRAGLAAALAISAVLVLAAYFIWPARMGHTATLVNPMESSRQNFDSAADLLLADPTLPVTQQPTPDRSLRSGEALEQSPAESRIDPLQVIDAVDQWKRDAAELSAKIHELSQPDSSWQSAITHSQYANDLELQQLQGHIENLSTGVPSMAEQ
ncbi:MAG: serine/threonine-protein kinase [Pirellulaceae bacterium]